MPSNQHPLKVALRGDDLLDAPTYNKGTAFSETERRAFGLTSRLPFEVNSLEQQLDRAKAQLDAAGSDLKKNEFLWSLQSQNIVLFYALLTKHLSELFPIIYTPTEAEAIEAYSHLFRRPAAGIFLAFPHRDTLEEDLKSHLYDRKGRKRQIDLVVVTDGEAILGVGDQGSGGIGISTAKAAIYSLSSGIEKVSLLPGKILSVVLDVGTMSKRLLEDPLYVGWRHERVRGDAYYNFVDRFIKVIESELGTGTLIHFEDFGLTNARVLLDKYRETHAVFNDDIQGTGCVTLAALQSALDVTGEKIEDQRVVLFGAGTAGLGIVRQLRDAISLSSSSDANSVFWLIDKEGLITKDSKDVREGLREFAREDWDGESGAGLEEVVRRVKPTVLIGTSTQGGAFTESIVREMAKHVERPIIFPLSNPTRLHEVKPQDAFDWTDGKALLATGSPFPPIKGQDGKEIEVGESNNALVYPGIGFGAILARATRISDGMLVAATKKLASLSPYEKTGSLLPSFADSRDINLQVALAVWSAAIDEGLATSKVDGGEAERKEFALAYQWTPKYRTYIYDRSDGEV